MTGEELRVDMHVKVLDEQVVERAKARGVDVLVYAPHFVRLPDIEERAARFSDDELLVVPAREIFTGDWRSRKHVLAVGLDEPVPDFVTLDGAMAELDRQDAAVLAPHPEFFTVSLDADDLETYREQVHAVEVYNPKHWNRHNERARELAGESGLPVFGSSYAHLRGTVGEVWTAFERPIESADDLVAALRSGAPRRVFHHDGAGHRARCAAEFSHLFWENGPSKLHLFLKGAKPTHPYHPAYGDQFYDIAVYGRPQIRSFQSTD